MTTQARKEPLEPLAFKGVAGRHWRLHRPNLVRKLQAKGVLESHLREAELRAEEMFVDLIEKGVDTLAAKEMAEREFLLLPDEP